MSIFKAPEAFKIARDAGEDLSSSLYHLANINTDAEVVLAGAGEFVLGTITEGAASGAPATVQFGGIAKVSLGGTVAAGALVAADGNGQAVTAGADDHVAGLVLEGGDSDEIVPLVLLRGLGV